MLWRAQCSNVVLYLLNYRGLHVVQFVIGRNSLHRFNGSCNNDVILGLCTTLIGMLGITFSREYVLNIVVTMHHHSTLLPHTPFHSPSIPPCNPFQQPNSSSFLPFRLSSALHAVLHPGHPACV